VCSVTDILNILRIIFLKNKSVSASGYLLLIVSQHFHPNNLGPRIFENIVITAHAAKDKNLDIVSPEERLELSALRSLEIKVLRANQLCHPGMSYFD
jgi:Fe-S cluster biosynthesis and repair protein YggX